MNKEIAKMLLNKYGSPLYVYDYELIKKKCLEMKNFSKLLEEKLNIKVSMHYSSKANGNPEILKLVRETGLCVDSMSLVELYLNELAGFKKEDILYVSNNITQEEMDVVFEKGILMCFDSVSQVETFGEKHPNSEIIVRINPGIKGVGHSKKVITSGKVTKFGISEENIPKLLEVAKKYNLNIIGVHQHLGSLFLNDKIDDYILGVKSGLEIINKYFSNLRIIDLGGGFGVPYKKEEKSLDLKILANKLIPILEEFISKQNSISEIKFEPGRYIPCEAGSVLGLVTSVKKSSDIFWIGTDIGMNILVRPSMYDSYHDISILNDNKKITANICGNICESGDVLGKNRIVNFPEIGDVVKVSSAGAYGYSMSSSYTGRLKPAEIMIYKDNTTKIIRKRETWEDFKKFFINQ